jgi:hypothetical protein
MSQATLEDLRDLIRRMCAYTRDYRPSSAECARDLEQLLYGIERKYHINLEEFARTTVLPIYESRARISPEDAIGANEDGDNFLAEVTGAITNPTPKTPPRVALAPYLFVGGLGFVVALLMIAAAAKALLSTGGLGAGTATSVAETVQAAEDGKVRVEFWIPNQTQARIGEDVFLTTKGAARIDKGRTLVELMFEDGRVLHCTFDASDGTTVRWVGNDSISVDDGDAVPCQQAKAPG